MAGCICAAVSAPGSAAPCEGFHANQASLESGALHVVRTSNFDRNDDLVAHRRFLSAGTAWARVHSQFFVQRRLP